MTTITAATTFTFPTDATAKSTWTASAASWSGESAENQFIDKVDFYLWGAAADKTGEEPYKTMNTWYTTNKTAIDSASLAASTQVGPWALWMDMQLAVRSSSMLGEPCYSADYSAASTTAVTCTTNNTNILKYISGHASLCSVIGDFGDSFAIGIQNATTTAKTPLLRWGAKTTAAIVTSGTTANGSYAVDWYQQEWTPSSTITDFAALTAAQVLTLSGAAQGSADFDTPQSVNGLPSKGVDITSSSSTFLSCDTAKWASTTACMGVTMWGLETTTTEAVMGSGTSLTSGTKGKKRAWLWLADANPTTASAVFGVEKDEALNVTLHQKTAFKCTDTTPGTADNVAWTSTTADERDSTRRYAWGVHTWTHSGASSTLLGASAVMAALVSFF